MEKTAMLIERAKSAMEKAYAPYSNFSVGAALLCSDGTVFDGCNVENVSFSATCCAERTALFKAVTEGNKCFEAIAVVGGKNGVIDGFCFPCGVCRQAFSEFCDDKMKIVLYNGKEVKTLTLGELLPNSFYF